MGMTIDNAIKMLIAKEKCTERDTSGIDTDCNSHNCNDCDLCYEQGTMGEQKKALKYAVQIMRKYQKIVDIVSLNGEEFKQCGLKELKEILEVIADGNDD